MQAQTEALRLRGRPRELIGIFPTPATLPPAVTVRIDELPGSEGTVELRAKVRRELEDGPSTLRVRLSPTTPPGKYGCTLNDGQADWLAVLEVEPHARTRLLSYGGDVAGPPGSEHRFTTTVMNLGNVSLEVRQSTRVHLTDGDLLHSVLSAVSAESGGDARLHALADGLADGDGGSVELTVAEGTGKLDPGETRELSVGFLMPSGLKSGHTYVGSWRLGATRYVLRLHPRDEADPAGAATSRHSAARRPAAKPPTARRAKPKVPREEPQ